MRSSILRLPLVAFLVLALFASAAPAQAPKDVAAIIDQLTAVDRQDTGYSASVTGSAFLPLGQQQTSMALLAANPRGNTNAMKSLVQLGVKAVPTLIRHLDDRRPTKITLTNKGGMMLLVARDDDKDKKKDDEAFGVSEYTVLVGDLCYVALGQIVNRNFSAVYYQPSLIVVATSVPNFKELRDELVKDWGKLTPETHRDSLIRDLETGRNDVRNGAALRLAYYYPEAFEAAILKEMARPAYDLGATNDLVYERLYNPDLTARERKELADAFVKTHGELGREGLRWVLFDALEFDESFDEQNPDKPKVKDGSIRRACLVEVFGYPPTVTSLDRPKVEPLSSNDVDFLLETLRFDRSEKIDRAFRDLLTRTEDYSKTKACVNRLVGRGYDDVIEAQLKRIVPKFEKRFQKDFDVYQSKLGWTRLHAAVDLGVAEMVETAIREKCPIDAKGRDGRTALHVAAVNGNLEMTNLLLAAKADATIKDNRGFTPLDAASKPLTGDFAFFDTARAAGRKAVVERLKQR